MKQKIFKISATVIISIASFTACTKNFEAINTPPEGATDITISSAYNAIISSLPITAGEYSVMNSWLYQITQLSMGQSGFPFNNASGVWSNYYQTLGTYRLLQDSISAATDSSKLNNVSAMLKTIMAYKTFKMTNYYGDMPYSKAGYGPLTGAGGYTASYDKQEDVYHSILLDLQWSVNNFSTDASQYSLGAYETFLQNDIETWIKFANSLRLYIAVTMYDKDNDFAKTQITDALNKPLLDDGDDIGLWPSKIPNLQFQWRQWSFSTNCYLRMGTTVWNLMSSSNDSTGAGIFDPRCKIYFEPDYYGAWKANEQNPGSNAIADGGAPYSLDRMTKGWSDKGVGCLISPVNYYFEQDENYIPELILTAAQTHFIKAEVYNRGLGVTANVASAQVEYNAGIKASVNMWTSIAYNSSAWAQNKPAADTATAAQLSSLISNSLIAYNTSNAAAALKQIYAQLWLDFYRQPWDAWTLMRRTGNKTPMSSVNAQSYTNSYGSYLRFTYPDDEATYNHANWLAETGGTDVTSSKIWIMP